MQQNRFWKNLIVISLAGGVIMFTIFAIQTIKSREDLVFLQIDLTDIVIEAKKCLNSEGKIQDIYEATHNGANPEEVFICTKQNITKAVYPNLQKLSRRHFNYKYLSPKKCLAKPCEDNKTRLNVGRGRRLVLSCDLEKGKCDFK